MYNGKRNSNIEILRILSAFAITFYHNSIWGGYSFATITANKVILDIFSLFGKIGVNIFAVIIGYFCIEKKFNLKKIIKIEGETLFFSWTLLVVMSIRMIFLNIYSSPMEYVKCIFPNLFGSYWYVSAYIILYLLSPFINKLLLSLNHSQFKCLLILLLVIWSVIPTMTLQVTSEYGMSNYMWLPITYCIGAYLKLYHKTVVSQRIKILTILFLLVHISVPIVCNILNGKFVQFATYFRNGNSILSVAITIGLFLCVVQKTPKYHRYINCLSGGAFAVYLLQEHIMFRPVLWGDILQVSAYQESKYLVFILLVDAILIYIVALGMHLIYKVLENKFEKISLVKIMKAKIENACKILEGV